MSKKRDNLIASVLEMEWNVFGRLGDGDCQMTVVDNAFSRRGESRRRRGRQCRFILFFRCLAMSTHRKSLFRRNQEMWEGVPQACFFALPFSSPNQERPFPVFSGFLSFPLFSSSLDSLRFLPRPFLPLSSLAFDRRSVFGSAVCVVCVFDVHEVVWRPPRFLYCLVLA